MNAHTHIPTEDLKSGHARRINESIAASLRPARRPAWFTRKRSSRWIPVLLGVLASVVALLLAVLLPSLLLLEMFGPEWFAEPASNAYAEQKTLEELGAHQ